MPISKRLGAQMHAEALDADAEDAIRWLAAQS
jgi:hypothetical protein